LYAILRWISVAYLLYLAWKIATSRPPSVDGEGGNGYRPFGFWRAAAFQWVNPKAWVMAIAAIVSYAPISSSSTVLRASVVVLLVAIIFAAVNLPSVGMWAYFGSVLQRFLHRPKLVGAINLTMAMLMVASLYPLIAE
jgi:threonine/homoserine/homoserine lactone efflux protein